MRYSHNLSEGAFNGRVVQDAESTRRFGLVASGVGQPTRVKRAAIDKTYFTRRHTQVLAAILEMGGWLIFDIAPFISCTYLPFLESLLPIDEALYAWNTTKEGSFPAQMTSSPVTEPEIPLGNDLGLGSYTALRLVCLIL